MSLAVHRSGTRQAARSTPAPGPATAPPMTEYTPIRPSAYSQFLTFGMRRLGASLCDQDADAALRAGIAAVRSTHDGHRAAMSAAADWLYGGDTSALPGAGRPPGGPGSVYEWRARQESNL